MLPKSELELYSILHGMVDYYKHSTLFTNKYFELTSSRTTVLPGCVVTGLNILPISVHVYFCQITHIGTSPPK